ncbi:MAG: hypothetical protein K9N46_00495 [Candidatus Marinimicrobia bacterium]|nr:hypothetical protein [Candidatus Neomarinimicrobiota bacterium]MCF7828046.1 hypothetical protein [Candidatus Neomarinimicrobiota bacterium]MCF7879199.1 hypothetical protein [Candidatus Neomarinimicrobiota bacterium]
MRKIISIFILGVLVGCGGGIQNDTPLPNSIQDMQISEIMQGGEADEVITKLHQKVVTDQENYIGEYSGKDYDATLYLTVYDNPDSALSDLNKMVERIQDPHVGGQMGYQHTRELTKYGENVYMALQNQRAHYFYVDGNELYWLDVDPHVAMGAIQQLTQ